MRTGFRVVGIILGRGQMKWTDGSALCRIPVELHNVLQHIPYYGGVILGGVAKWGMGNTLVGMR